MTVVIADCETDNLLPLMTKLWCVQIGDADGSDSVLYGDVDHCDAPLLHGIDRLRSADRVVFHNGLGFDLEAIGKFYPGAATQERCLDTLVMARLAQPQEKMHTLEAWGRRLNIHKGSFKGPYDVWTEEFASYSRQDIVVGRALYHKVKHVLDWGESYQIEHDVQRALILQERNGFRLDVVAAEKLSVELRGRLSDINKELQHVFPPITRRRTLVPKRNNGPRGLVAGVPHHTDWMEPFNPGSRAHVAERLQIAGWKPAKDGYGTNGVPTVDEKVLSGIKLPVVEPILRYFAVTKQLGQLSDGKTGWLRIVGADGIMHGRVNGNGAVTGRMSHYKPNMAQVDSSAEMRSLWGPTRSGWRLVGCDAEGLEARMLAHYLAQWDDGAFASKVLLGDFHTANFEVLKRIGMASRGGTKNWLYALMYGGGDWKLGEMIKQNARDCNAPIPTTASKALGALSRKMIAKSMVGIDRLTEACKAKTRSRGYLIGLDGRQIECRSEHSALNTLLQGGGAVVMKKALQLFMQSEGHWYGQRFALCANVHDEVQLEAYPMFAEGYGLTFAHCIVRAGDYFNLKCPMAGKSSVGVNWSETH